MYTVGEKIVYGETGVCTVESIGPLPMAGMPQDKDYYQLIPLIGTGNFFAPVDGGVFMRPVMSRDEAEALIDAIPSIEPAICNDSRFNHVDAFYKELFRQHSCAVLVSIVKGLHSRMADRKSRSSRAEATMKRAKDMLHGELSVALDMDVKDVEDYISSRIAGMS